MALRVLLADESSTIKKVMQLALSDFGVEVKSVPVGLDVLPVTKTFKPDIIFADILLTKRNGYEVCAEIKNDPETTRIPVVLMWSGFMEVDEGKISESKADGRLEKPFDADHLRKLVNDLVQKAKTNPVSSFLTFPQMPDFAEEAPVAESAPAVIEDIDNIYAIPEENEPGFVNIPSVDENEISPLEIPGEEFSAVPLTSPKENLGEEEQDEGGWAHQDLKKFKLNIPVDSESEDFASKFVIPQDDDLSADLSGARFEVAGDFEEVSFHENGLEEVELGPDLTMKKPGQRPPPPPLQGAGPTIPTPAKPTPTPQAAKPSSKPTAGEGPSLIEELVPKVEKSVKDQMLASLRKGPSAAKPNVQSQDDITTEMMEKIVREEAREAIEAVCWKLIPEIAERIVREEINKILRETEKSI